VLQFLVPDDRVPAVTAIDPRALARRGIRALLVDLDNTLTGWNAGDAGQALAAWLQRVRSAGIRVCVVSNNVARRVEPFCLQLDLPSVSAARKPGGRGFRRALRLIGTQPAETAVVGDQVFTDVLGGKRLGLHTILVEPVNSREFFGTRAVRVVERLWLGYLRRRGRVA
jgi:HAD superfamily phosphatase (TIGR01668 family)